MALVSFAQEGDAPDARYRLLASRASFDDCSMQASRVHDGAEVVAIEAADFAARREDRRAGVGARGEDEALHGLQIDVEPRATARCFVVEPLGADDGHARAHHVYALRR